MQFIHASFCVQAYLCKPVCACCLSVRAGYEGCLCCKLSTQVSRCNLSMQLSECKLPVQVIYLRKFIDATFLCKILPTSLCMRVSLCWISMQPHSSSSLARFIYDSSQNIIRVSAILLSTVPLFMPLTQVFCFQFADAFRGPSAKTVDVATDKWESRPTQAYFRSQISLGAFSPSDQGASSEAQSLQASPGRSGARKNATAEMRPSAPRTRLCIPSSLHFNPQMFNHGSTCGVIQPGTLLWIARTKSSHGLKKNRGQPLYPYASVSVSIGFFPLHRFAVFWQLWLESGDFSVQV